MSIEHEYNPTHTLVFPRLDLSVVKTKTLQPPLSAFQTDTRPPELTHEEALLHAEHLDFLMLRMKKFKITEAARNLLLSTSELATAGRTYTYNETAEIFSYVAGFTQIPEMGSKRDIVREDFINVSFQFFPDPDQISTADALICFSYQEGLKESFMFWGLERPGKKQQLFSKLFMAIK